MKKYIVICIDKENGDILKKIDLATNTPTCLAFGGPNLSYLFVTSLRSKNFNESADGNLFKIKTKIQGVEQILSKI